MTDHTTAADNLTWATDTGKWRHAQSKFLIDAAEARQHRMIREMVLGHEGARERLQDLENEIDALRAMFNEKEPT